MSSKLKSSKRYPGVFTRSIKSRVDQKKDTHFYIRFRANGKARKKMVGTHLKDGMTAYKASVIRSKRIQETIGNTKGSEKSQNFREIVQTFNSIFQEYLKHRQIKSIDQDTYRYQKHIQSQFGDRTPESIRFDEYKEFREIISADRKPSTVRNILELMR